MAPSFAAMNELMPPEPCASLVPEAQVIVEPDPVPVPVQSAGHSCARYCVKPVVELEPSTRWTTLMAVAGSVIDGLSAVIAASFHTVMERLKIFASTHAFRRTVSVTPASE